MLCEQFPQNPHQFPNLAPTLTLTCRNAGNACTYPPRLQCWACASIPARLCASSVRVSNHVIAYVYASSFYYVYPGHVTGFPMYYSPLLCWIPLRIRVLLGPWPWFVSSSELFVIVYSRGPRDLTCSVSVRAARGTWVHNDENGRPQIPPQLNSQDFVKCA